MLTIPSSDWLRSCICCQAASTLSPSWMRDAVSGRLERIWSGRMLLGPGSIVDVLSDLSSSNDSEVASCVSTSSFSLPWHHFPCPGPAFGTTVPGGVFLSLPALLLSWKIPLNLPCPLFHNHLIGLDHFHLLLSQATAAQSVPDSSTFFIWIYWFYPACLGHSFFVSALVSPTTLCPWLSLCVYSVFCLPWYCFPQVINKAFIKLSGTAVILPHPCQDCLEQAWAEQSCCSNHSQTLAEKFEGFQRPDGHSCK